MNKPGVTGELFYVSNWGFGALAGGGEILKIDITCAKKAHGLDK